MMGPEKFGGEPEMPQENAETSEELRLETEEEVAARLGSVEGTQVNLEGQESVESAIESESELLRENLSELDTNLSEFDKLTPEDINEESLGGTMEELKEKTAPLRDHAEALKNVSPALLGAIGLITAFIAYGEGYMSQETAQVVAETSVYGGVAMQGVIALKMAAQGIREKLSELIA